MKSAVAAANDAVWPAQSLAVKSVATTRHRISAFNWKISEIKTQQIFYVRKSRNLRYREKNSVFTRAAK